MSEREDRIKAIQIHYRLAMAAMKCRISVEHSVKSTAKYLGVDADPVLFGEAQDAAEMMRAREKEHRKLGEAIVKAFPEWQAISAARGFGLAGMMTIIGEAGDPSLYQGPRKLYKRLGLAPDSEYPTGKKKTGRMIPRSSRGRVMGAIADPLMRAQIRAGKEGEPSRAIGPYGETYLSNKARHVEAGKALGHAHALARRAMIKHLLRDIHAAFSVMATGVNDADEVRAVAVLCRKGDFAALG